MKVIPFFRPLAIAAIIVFISAINFSAVHAADGSKDFKYRCGSCHTIGKGKMVGPDLRDVSSRRSTEWIHRFIRSSQTMIKNGDAEAVALFKEYNQSVMPDHPDIQDAEIDGILVYIEEQSAIFAARENEGPVRTDFSAIPKARSINVESVSINDPMFKLLYWITAFVAFSAVFMVGWYIARLSQ